MSKNTMTMSDDAHALAVYASISGRSTSTEVVDESKVGSEKTTERKTEEIIANVERFDAAKTLVGKLRACLARFATNVEPLGFITDPARLDLFKAAVADIENDIEAHNAIAGQEHVIRHDVLILPVGRILDEKSQRRLCETVSEALTEARAMLKAGDVKGLGAWIQHRKNLAGLMPPIVANAVQDGIDQLIEQRKRVTKLMKDGERAPADAGAMAEVDLVDTAIVWVSTSQTGVTNEGHALQ